MQPDVDGATTSRRPLKSFSEKLNEESRCYYSGALGIDAFSGKTAAPDCGQAASATCLGAQPRAKTLDAVIIATDDMRIAEAAFSWGAEVALTSPKHRSGTDRIAEVAAKLRDAAYIINVQGDEPLIDPGLINRFCAKTAR